VYFDRSAQRSHVSGSNSVAAPKTMRSVSPAGHAMVRSRTLILNAVESPFASVRLRTGGGEAVQEGTERDGARWLVAQRESLTSTYASRSRVLHDGSDPDLLPQRRR
jgi:hypothetical protein